MKEELDVLTPSINTPVRRLSGGNVQKVLVGREIAQNPSVLMTAYAVRGLDINTSYTIYNLPRACRDFEYGDKIRVKLFGNEVKEFVVLGFVRAALDSPVDHVSQLVETNLFVHTFHLHSFHKIDLVIIRSVECDDDVPCVQPSVHLNAECRQIPV